MNTEELMDMAVDKAINEVSWKSIEFLFKPMNQGELLLRLDFNGMKNRVYEAFADKAPNAMPHRFRSEYWPMWKRAIWKEEFYIKLKKEHDKRNLL